MISVLCKRICVFEFSSKIESVPVTFLALKLTNAHDFVLFPGYNPLFDESFEFQINLPELALVRFAVLDDDYIGDAFIGQYTIPFECMQTGMVANNAGDDVIGVYC